MRRLRGFTLIEIAVVLFIGALLISGVVQYVTAQITSARLAATRGKQDAIKSALVNFIARNNRLPCPAVATIANGAANNGVEAPTPRTCTGTVISGVAPLDVATGTIPWVSLGLSNEVSLDAYGNRFTYQVARGATNTTVATVAGMNGAIEVHNATPVAAGNQTNQCTPAGAAYNPCSAVVVVVSHGIDGYGAYTDSGVQLPVPAAIVNGDEWENTNADNTFVVKTFSGALANPYDDIVMALTANDLLAALTAGGGMQDFRAVLNADFNIIKSALIANLSSSLTVLTGCDAQSTPMCLYAPATACIAGNCPITQYQYNLMAPDSLPTANTIPAAINLPATATVDPWGKPIKYFVTTSTIAPTTAGNLVAFQLVSSGPDGTAGNTDDMSMTVYVSEVQAQAAKFR